jgi:tRNA nucleotidyltransferase (CCA-adding enzyme)
MKITLPDFIGKAMEILKSCGYEGYLVGGCVRDFLMGKTPADFDMATNATPAEVMECFRGCRVIETGLSHGTVTVFVDGHKIEITTYRIDGKYEDNRHPSAVYFTGDLKEDLARRDFTINAMALGENGLVDLFGGREHIEKKLIVCVGDADKRFNEDGLRILRALRFAAVLGFDIDSKTAESIHRNKSLLHNIAKERIYSEFSILLCGKSAAGVIRHFYDVVCEFIPEIQKAVDFRQNSRYHIYDVFTHTLVVMDNVKPDLILRLAALFHDIGKPYCYTQDEDGTGHFHGHGKVGSEMARTILKRLKADNSTAETVARLVLEHDIKIEDYSERALKRFLSGRPREYVKLLTGLKKADAMGKSPAFLGDMEKIEKCERVIDKLYDSGECITLKSLAVNGGDLLKLGIPKGPAIGEILKKLLDYVIDGRVRNEKAHLLAEAKKIYFNLKEKTK